MESHSDLARDPGHRAPTPRVEERSAPKRGVSHQSCTYVSGAEAILRWYKTLCSLFPRFHHTGRWRIAAERGQRGVTLRPARAGGEEPR
jgi:hypothetical protein